MLEKDIENLIAQYPDDFFPNSGFRLKGQQIQVGRCRIDIMFIDKYYRKIVVEVKRGILSRNAAGQIIEYYGLLKQEYPNEVIELILCANVIPPERRMFLENVGIEYKELGISLITKIAKKYGYKFLSEKKSKDVVETQEFPSIKPGQKIWIFQANPSRYDILNALSDLNYLEEVWTINQYKKEIKNGDIALIWISGPDAGIYAVANIVSNPEYISLSPEEEKYWINEEDKGKNRLRVRINIVKKLINDPVFRSELKDIKELSNLSILKFSQGTNFPVTDEEWSIIKSKIEEKTGSWRYVPNSLLLDEKGVDKAKEGL